MEPPPGSPIASHLLGNLALWKSFNWNNKWQLPWVYLYQGGGGEVTIHCFQILVSIHQQIWPLCRTTDTLKSTKAQTEAESLKCRLLTLKNALLTSILSHTCVKLHMVAEKHLWTTALRATVPLDPMHRKCQKVVPRQMCKQNRTPSRLSYECSRGWEQWSVGTPVRITVWHDSSNPSSGDWWLALGTTASALNSINGFNLKRLLQEKITPHTRGSTCPDGAMTMPERKAEKFPRPTRKLDLL